MGSALTVRDNTTDETYEGIIDDKVVGLVGYKRLSDRVVIRHTVIEPQFRDAGLGTTMVRGVLDDIRARGDKLTNYCGFVADFLAAHPDYQDLIDTSRPGVTLPRDKRGKDSDAPAIYQ